MIAPGAQLRLRAGSAIATLLGIALMAACGNDDDDPTRREPNPAPASAAAPQPLARVEAILKSERDTLLRRYEGAVGVAVGSIDPDQPRPPDDPVYLVVVYLRDREALPKDDEVVKGVPIRFVVTGEFRAG